MYDDDSGGCVSYLAKSEPCTRNTGGDAGHCLRGRQSTTLNRFMISQFTKRVWSKYSRLFSEQMANDLSNSTNELNDGTVNPCIVSLSIGHFEEKANKFLETVLRRARSSTLQFKRVCCIILKFAECCTGETNYMRFLRYDFYKLVVAAFVLSVSNTHGDFGDKMAKREEIYNFYAKITGLSMDEVTNCCSIVRPVLILQSRHQRKFLRLRQHQEQQQDDEPRSSGSGDMSSYNHENRNPNCFMINLKSSRGCGIEQSAGANSNASGDTDDKGYVLVSEIEQFDQVGKKMVLDYFRVV